MTSPPNCPTLTVSAVYYLPFLTVSAVLSPPSINYRLLTAVFYLPSVNCRLLTAVFYLPFFYPLTQSPIHPLCALCSVLCILKI